MARQQLGTLHGRERILEMLGNFARKDMPGEQNEIAECVNTILVRAGVTRRRADRGRGLMERSQAGGG